MRKEQKLEGEYGRDYIVALSHEDRKHGINSMGRLAEENAYGEVVEECKHTGRILPVICGHGGSMWLCRSCKNEIVKNLKT